jgi:hypothetical protein
MIWWARSQPAGHPLGVGDEPGTQDIAGEVGDAVRPDAFVEDAEFFEVLQVGQAAVDGRFHGFGDELGVFLAAASAAGSGLCIPKTDFLWLRKGEQPQRLLVRHTGSIAVALCDQLKADVEVLDQLVMCARPLRRPLLFEDQERISEHGRVCVKYGVEPVVALVPGDVELFAEVHRRPDRWGTGRVYALVRTFTLLRRSGCRRARESKGSNETIVQIVREIASLMPSDLTWLTIMKPWWVRHCGLLVCGSRRVDVRTNQGFGGRASVACN